jgi:hypothetical protein
MKIENAKYHALDGDNTKPNASITCVIDGKLTSVPISEGNTKTSSGWRTNYSRR